MSGAAPRPNRLSAWLRSGTEALIAGCLLGAPAALPASADLGRKPVKSMWEVRQAQVVRQKWDLSCGAAALSTLFTYQYGDPISEAEIIKDVLRRTDPVKIRARQGFSLLDLKRFAERQGYSAEGYGSVELTDLLKLAPAIVPTQIDGYNHFVVFRGMQGDRVLFADPAYGNRTMRVDTFLRAWPMRVAFVLLGKDGASPPAALAPHSDQFLVPDATTVWAVIQRTNPTPPRSLP